MSVAPGREEARTGLFAALKNLLATFLAIGRTRAELLVTEIEEEKLRLMSLWAKAVGAAFLLALGVIMAVCCITLAFWEQRVVVFGAFAACFLVGAGGLILSLRRQAARPSALFRASLAELEADIAQLDRRGRQQP